MTIPKIKFKKMTLEQNINIIIDAFLNNREKTLDIHNLLMQYFPELCDIHKNISKEEISQKIKIIVTNYYTSNSQNIENACLEYTKTWNKYNDIYFKKLSNYLNINWPININEITCYVGMLPFFPRDIDNYTFYINPHLNEEKLTEVCAHETLHFLWFTKWKTLYPEIPKAEYESPYLAWQYSEMVTDPILNNTDFQAIFDFTEKSYPEFYKLQKNGKLVMEELKKIYSASTNIEDKITTGYEYLKNLNFKEMEKFVTYNAIAKERNKTMKRCLWCNLKNPLYVEYHDKEWGVLNLDDNYLFEMLILEMFQAGLSWECILNKRENFKRAYDNFAIDKIIKYDDVKKEELYNNKGIIRNKLKINASINNSAIFKEIQKEYGSFSKYLLSFIHEYPIYETGLTTSQLSDSISKDLIKRGMKFTGSTIIYSYLQAIGIINSHETECFLHKK